MRWLLPFACGCRAILGIDTPEQPIDGHARDGTVSGDGALDAFVPVADAPPGAPIAIQGAAHENTGGGNTVTVPLGKPVVAGDLIVVAFGALDNVGLPTVTDTVGSSFTAATPTTASGGISIGMYYGFAAASGTDTITVMFASNQSFPDVRVGEYRGVSQLATIDVTTGNTGSSNDCNATLTTSRPNDLLVAANFDASFVTGPGSGFDQRALSDPGKNILEDRIAVTPGTYTANAPIQSSVPWVMELVAFSSQ